MSRIIWLASYPKSGNTWMRALLANYIMNREEPVKLAELNDFTLSDTIQGFYTKVTGKPIEKITLEESVAIRPTVLRLIANSKPHDHFVKTHTQPAFPNGAQLIDPSVSLGAIYIVRNPCDLVFSYAEHFGMSVDLAIRDLGDAENTTVSPHDQIVSYLGSWSGHVTSWTGGSIPVCLVRLRKSGWRGLSGMHPSSLFRLWKKPTGSLNGLRMRAGFSDRVQPARARKNCQSVS